MWHQLPSCQWDGQRSFIIRKLAGGFGIVTDRVNTSRKKVWWTHPKMAGNRRWKAFGVMGCRSSYSLCGRPVVCLRRVGGGTARRAWTPECQRCIMRGVCGWQMKWDHWKVRFEVNVAAALMQSFLSIIQSSHLSTSEPGLMKAVVIKGSSSSGGTFTHTLRTISAEVKRLPKSVTLLQFDLMFIVFFFLFMMTQYQSAFWLGHFWRSQNLKASYFYAIVAALSYMYCTVYVIISTPLVCTRFHLFCGLCSHSLRRSRVLKINSLNTITTEQQNTVIHTWLECLRSSGG